MSQHTEQLTDKLRATLALNEIDAYKIDDFDHKRLTFVYLSRSYIDKVEIEILKNFGFEVVLVDMDSIETIEYNWESCLRVMIKAIDLVEVNSMVE